MRCPVIDNKLDRGFMTPDTCIARYGFINGMNLTDMMRRQASGGWSILRKDPEESR